ncbi:hypothetical protein [Desulfovibrio sp.]|uniref:hypothetical protein n=1 Tax=Desulfovibrio sp. TaxID=885 RepID=UPI002A91901C|nr:hypothetical protein [Desulfovibrio sp.]MDY5429877.1 hypothetical protein [Desulfovibrio sp.]
MEKSDCIICVAAFFVHFALIKEEKEFMAVFYKIFLKIQEKEDPLSSLQQQVGEQFYLFKKRNSC